MLHFLLIFFILFVILAVAPSRWLATGPHQNTNKKAFYICLSIMCALAAFRSSIVGNDTESYIYVFRECEDLLKYGSRYEIGYIYLNILLKKISQTPQIVFIFCSIFIYFSFGRFIWKYSQMPWLSILLFFLLVFSSTVNIMRQCVAIGFLLWSIDFILERKFIHFIIIIALASLFHNTAIFFSVAWFLPKIPLTLRTVKLFVVVALIGFLAFDSLLNYAFDYFSMYELYSDSIYFEGETRTATFLQLFISLFVSIIGYISYNRYADECWKDTTEGKIQHLLVLLHIVASVLYFLCLKVNLLDRISLYFSVFSFISIVNAIYLLPYEMKKKMIIISVLFFLTYQSCIITYRPNWNCVYPLEFYWNDKKTTQYI